MRAILFTLTTTAFPACLLATMLGQWAILALCGGAMTLSAWAWEASTKEHT